DGYDRAPTDIGAAPALARAGFELGFNIEVGVFHRNSWESGMLSAVGAPRGRCDVPRRQVERPPVAAKQPRHAPPVAADEQPQELAVELKLRPKGIGGCVVVVIAEDIEPAQDQ